MAGRMDGFLNRKGLVGGAVVLCRSVDGVDVEDAEGVDAVVGDVAALALFVVAATSVFALVMPFDVFDAASSLVRDV